MSKDGHKGEHPPMSNGDAKPAGNGALAQPTPEAFGTGLLMPLAALLLVSVLAVSGLLVYAVERQNTQSMQNARHLAMSLVKSIGDEMARIAKDHAWWDTAHENLVVSVDLGWADDNVGPYAHEAFGFTCTFVVSNDDRTVYGAVEGARRSASPTEVLGPGITPLIAEARRQSMEVPETVTGFVRAADGLHMVGATAITREDLEGTNPPQAPRAVLVYSRRVDKAFLAGLAKDYLLDGLHVEFRTPAATVAALALKDISGRVVGSLVWSPSNPGSGFVNLMVVPLSLLAVIAIVATALIVRRAQSAAGEMVAQASALAAKNEELTEQQRIASQSRIEAEIANEAKSRFLANVSHELRSPLDAIIGYSDLVGRQLGKDGGDRMLIEQSAAINQAGHHLLDLIDDLIDISRIEVGVLPLDERTIDPRNVVQFCRRLLAKRSQDARITFDASVADEVPLLRADERRLRQILINLLTNAVKYTPEGGLVVLSCEMKDDGIAFAVSDNGPGIHTQDLERLLQPFQRGANVTAEEKREGAGLGLALAKGLVEEHAGKLVIDSSPGHGTTMIAAFPPERCVVAAA